MPKPGTPGGTPLLPIILKGAVLIDEENCGIIIDLSKFLSDPTDESGLNDGISFEITKVVDEIEYAIPVKIVTIIGISI